MLQQEFVDTGSQGEERKRRVLTALKKCAENPSPIGDCRKCEAYLREYEACAYAYGRELGLPTMSELR